MKVVLFFKRFIMFCSGLLVKMQPIFKFIKRNKRIFILLVAIVILLITVTVGIKVKSYNDNYSEQVCANNDIYVTYCKKYNCAADRCARDFSNYLQQAYFADVLDSFMTSKASSEKMEKKIYGLMEKYTTQLRRNRTVLNEKDMENIEEFFSDRARKNLKDGYYIISRYGEFEKEKFVILLQIKLDKRFEKIHGKTFKSVSPSESWYSLVMLE